VQQVQRQQQAQYQQQVQHQQHAQHQRQVQHRLRRPKQQNRQPSPHPLLFPLPELCVKPFEALLGVRSWPQRL
jgi:hypothetical protein